jgi:hypothetical protein
MGFMGLPSKMQKLRWQASKGKKLNFSPRTFYKVAFKFVK